LCSTTVSTFDPRGCRPTGDALGKQKERAGTLPLGWCGNLGQNRKVFTGCERSGGAVELPVNVVLIYLSVSVLRKQTLLEVKSNV
jgi:hypothetical protein